MLFLYGFLTATGLGAATLLIVGGLHIKRKIRLPGSPDIDRVTGLELTPTGATKEDVR